MLTASDVTEVLTEITSLLRGGWIQKIQQPTDRTLVLDVRLPGHTHRLLISCHPDFARLHVTTQSLANPPTPPPFCQFLRAHFQGARIDDIRQIENDRIRGRRDSRVEMFGGMSRYEQPGTGDIGCNWSSHALHDPAPAG